MSSNNSIPVPVGRSFVRTNISKEEADKGNNVKKASLTVMVLIVLAAIVIVALLLHTQFYNPKDDSEEQQNKKMEIKKKVTTGLSISAIALVVLSAFASFWQYSAAKQAAAVCIGNGPNTR